MNKSVIICVNLWTIFKASPSGRLVGCFFFFFLFATVVTNAGNKVVQPVVHWDKTIGTITNDHWGVNDMGAGFRKVNTRMAQFYKDLRPGIVRIHHNRMVRSWVNEESHSWNKEKIREVFENAKDTYKYAERVMITLDCAPLFISETLPLTETQEDELAAFFAQLPLIIKEMGFRVDLYEFLNEKEKPYKDDYMAYWRMLNKIAVAMKTADPTVKCGGPAVSWPWEEIYKGFIDNCSENMDFVSFHLYARGPGEFAEDDLFTGAHEYRNQSEAAGAVVEYMKEKKVTHLEVFLDEFNVQYVWKPYQPDHHNHIGASWMACFIKNVALTGVTGLHVWNTEDGSYGLNYTSAPAQLYLLSRHYLRGKIVDSSDPADLVEILPVLSDKGEKSILFVNRTAQPLTLKNLQKLIKEKSGVRVFRLDGTTKVKDKEYEVKESGLLKSGTVINPYGMILITNVN